MKTDIHSFDDYASSILRRIIDYSPRAIAALLLLVGGIWIIGFITRFSRKIMQRRDVEPTLVKFLSDIVLWGLRVILFIAVISKLGIESSSFVAILGAAGLAIGLSLQGSLSNFAGGVLIILFKPFRLGDTIEAQGVTGTVTDIRIFITELITANNQVIFIPNGALSNGTIINYSHQKTRRTDIPIGVSYDTNLKDVKDLLQSVLDSHSKVLAQPAPVVAVTAFADNGTRLALRGWTKNEDYGDVVSDLLENAKAALDQKGIVFQPFVKEFSKSQ